MRSHARLLLPPCPQVLGEPAIANAIAAADAAPPQAEVMDVSTQELIDKLRGFGLDVPREGVLKAGGRAGGRAAVECAETADPVFRSAWLRSLRTAAGKRAGNDDDPLCIRSRRAKRGHCSGAWRSLLQWRSHTQAQSGPPGRIWAPTSSRSRCSTSWSGTWRWHTRGRHCRYVTMALRRRCVAGTRCSHAANGTPSPRSSFWPFS